MEKNTKERLMEAAIELFSTKGYHATSVDEIAQSIGLKGPNLYKYFKGKEDLMDAIMDRADKEYTAGMVIRTKDADSVHSVKTLKAITLKSIDFTINNEMIRRIRSILAIEQFRDKKFAQRTTKYQLSDLMTVHTGLFRRLMKEGVMITGDPKVCALEYCAPITLLIQLSDRDPEQKEYAMKMIKKHIDMFLQKYFVSGKAKTD